MRVSLLLLSLLLATFAPAQQLLRGQVLDAVTQQPIPFAVLEMPARHLGAQADQAGSFSLKLPDNLSPADSLTLSALGYHRQRVPVPGAAPCVLLLKPLPPTELPAVVVRPSPAAPIRIGALGRRGQSGFACNALSPERRNGWQVARFFAAPPVGIIQSVAFLVQPPASCGRKMVLAPFRVRLYAADGPAGAPGTDLLTTSLVASPTKPGWHHVDVASFQLPSPPGGFYVAFEWVYTSDAFLCPYTFTEGLDKQPKRGLNYGSKLGGTYEGQPLTWYLTGGYPWQQFRPRPDGQRINAAIQATIQP